MSWFKERQAPKKKIVYAFGGSLLVFGLASGLLEKTANIPTVSSQEHQDKNAHTLFVEDPRNLEQEQQTFLTPSYISSYLAIDPHNPDIMYTTFINRSGVVREDPTKPEGFAGYAGGLFKTEDRGKTWRWLIKGLEEGFTLGKIAIDPKDTRVLYMTTTLYSREFGTVFPDRCGDLGYFCGGMQTTRGLYRSLDGGENWEKISLLISSFAQLVIDPKTSTIYLFDADFPFGTNLQMSPDRGQTWQKVTDSFVRPGNVAINPEKTNVLYATGGIKTPDGFLVRGLLRSEDSGTTWEIVKDENGTPLEWGQTPPLVIDSQKNLVYAALTLAVAGNIVNPVIVQYNEETREVKDLRISWPINLGAGNIALNPVSTTLYAGTGPYGTSKTGVDWINTPGAGVFISKDEGQIWRQFNEGLPQDIVDGAIYEIDVDPTGKNVYAVGWTKARGFETYKSTNETPWQLFAKPQVFSSYIPVAIKSSSGGW